jgi:hypothetical protein
MPDIISRRGGEQYKPTMVNLPDPPSPLSPRKDPSLSTPFPSTSTAVPFFYRTCPQFHQDDLDKERAGLSDSERHAIFEDIAGIAPVPREPPDFVQQRLREFHEALDAIPLDQKKSYAAAVERKSTEFVFEEEASPLAFLRAELFDAVKAAQRFVDYWSVRHTIFGDERAFRSMVGRNSSKREEESSEPPEHDFHGGDDDDDDSGCMSDMDREAVGMGVVKALPSDAHGRVVIFFKRNCVPKEVADRQPVLVRSMMMA